MSEKVPTTSKTSKDIPVRINTRGYVRPRVYNTDSELNRKAMKFEDSVDNSDKSIFGQDESADDRNIEDIHTHSASGEQMFTQRHSHICEELTKMNFAAWSESSSRNLDVTDAEKDSDDCNFDWYIDDEHNDDDDHCHEEDDEIEPELILDENLQNEDTANQPIYSGHYMTINTSLILIWVFAMVHSITGSQLSDLLSLVSAHCLYTAPVYSSLKRFKSYFANLKTQMVKHYYCKFCLLPVDKNVETCPNHCCMKNLKKNKLHFIEFPIEEQIRQIFSRKGVTDHLHHRFQRRRKNPNNLEDIYDGEIYKSMSAPGQPLSAEYPYNLSFTWNTDGIPLFKSSKVSVWPVYLMINELPYNMRKQKENMLFYGLWFADVKPVVTTFFKPLYDSLKHLEDKGMKVTTENDEEILIKCFLLCGTADLPAKSMTLNMMQFNGAHSCIKCNQKGATEKIGQRGHTHIFPFDKSNPAGQPRKHRECVEYAVEATEKKQTVNGIKGPSFLMALDSYDYVRSTGIDYMHSVLLGMTKRLTSLWFTLPFSQCSFSMLNSLELVDDHLSQIKPPHVITRRPRSIAGHLKYWKASEFRAWLLFYSLPILVNLMKPDYFFHYCAFVEAIWLLCKDSISESDIERSNMLLNYFVFMLGPLYGERYMTLNAHSLLHLSECVKDLGPLWVYSCFPFESLNGQLLKFFHGTQSFDIQIMGAVNVHQILPGLVNGLPEEYRKMPFIRRYSNKAKTSLGIKLDHDVYAVGNMQTIVLNHSQHSAIFTLFGYMPQNLRFYDRIFLRNGLFHSISYKRVTARNSYTVKYIGHDSQIYFGHIEFFVVASTEMCKCTETCTCAKNILVSMSQLKKGRLSIIPKCDENPYYLKLSAHHIHHVGSVETSELVDIHNILSLCVDVSFKQDEHFVCEMANFTETD